MMTRRRFAPAATLATLLVMGGAAPAHATLFDRLRFAFTDSVQEDVCGIHAEREPVK